MAISGCLVLMVDGMFQSRKQDSVVGDFEASNDNFATQVFQSRKQDSVVGDGSAVKALIYIGYSSTFGKPTLMSY